MSKRIAELAAKALDQTVHYTWTKLDYFQIKELQECFAKLLLEEVQNRLYDVNGAEFAEDIDEHFYGLGDKE